MTLFIDDADFQLHVGDALETLQAMPAESVHCCVTSPPYWGLRDYSTEGQLGLEPTPDQYVASMVAVFREVRRVLRADGTLWLNIGDSYASQPAGNKTPSGFSQTRRAASEGALAQWRPGNPDKNGGNSNRDGTPVPPGLKPKDLVGIPWRLAFALQADGWYLRSDIIWSKPNPMPESVTDRPTKAHEYLFLLTKSPRYFYDADAIREPATYAGKTITLGEKSLSKGQANGANVAKSGNALRDSVVVTDGRNKRSVWEIATEAYPDAHFATFPQALVEPCIKAGTSEHGCCPECGAPWERESDSTTQAPEERQGNKPIRYMASAAAGAGQTNLSRSNLGMVKRVATTGWRPSCDHTAAPVPCIVLDPFLGSGTTAQVARRLGRRCIGIELNPEYAELAARRLQQQSLFA